MIKFLNWALAPKSRKNDRLSAFLTVEQKSFVYSQDFPILNKEHLQLRL